MRGVYIDMYETRAALDVAARVLLEVALRP
jgi:hypothetical protein